MSLDRIDVIFGAQSTPRLEERVNELYRGMQDKSAISFSRDESLNTSMMVVAGGVLSFYGSQAFLFLTRYGESSRMSDDFDQRRRVTRTLAEYEDPLTMNRLAKTRVAPYVQYSESAPTTGHHWQYVEPKYLPEENMGMYDHSILYPLTSSYPLVGGPLNVDGRTRLPSRR